MTRTSSCPRCRSQFVLPANLTRAQVRCKSCQAVFVVGAETTPAMPAAPAVPVPVAPARPASASGWKVFLAALGVVLLVCAGGVLAGKFLLPTNPPGQPPKDLTVVREKATPAEERLADPGPKRDERPKTEKPPEEKKVEPKKVEPEKKAEEPARPPSRFRPRLPSLPVARPVPKLPGSERAGPLRQLRILLVSDTDAKDYDSETGAEKPTSVIARSAEADAQSMSNLFTKTLGPVAQITRLRGAAVHRDTVLEYYRTVPVDEQTGLVFFYSGHGAIEEGGQHLLMFHSGYLGRNELLLAMRARNPGFLAVLTDCCSSFTSRVRSRPAVAGVAERRAEFGEGPGKYPEPVCKTIENLFLEHRGIVDVTAAEPGKFGCAVEEYGYFTRGVVVACQMDRKLVDGNKDEFVSWNEMWPWMRENTNALFLMYPVPGQDSQYAHAFQLPTGREDISPPPRRLEPGGGLVTIRNNTKRTVHYSLQKKDSKPIFIHEVEPGNWFIHHFTSLDGRPDPLVMSYKVAEGDTTEVSVDIDYFVIKGTLIRSIPERGTQYQFLSDETGKKIQLFTY